MSLRRIAESRSNLTNGVTKWHNLMEDGGSTKSALMEWPVPNFTGAEWLHSSFDCATWCSHRLTGALFLWTISAGSLEQTRPLRIHPKLLLFLAALGCPLSWHKTMLSEVNTWLGFQVNPCGPVVDFPMDKRSTLKDLLHTIASGDSFTAKEIERALGRLNWATAAWPLSRPFLQPFWAWKSATTSSGKPSKLIRSFARLLLQLLHNPQIQPCPYDPASNWWGASDASAHPVDGAYIGGWIADCENPSKEQTWWFHYKVPLEDHYLGSQRW